MILQNHDTLGEYQISFKNKNELLWFLLSWNKGFLRDYSQV